jgi:acetyltransferase-like isoleucine patch superfamily enzyme
MNLLKLFLKLLDIHSFKRDIWHFISDYIFILNTDLFALLRGIVFNFITTGRLSAAYIYKDCNFFSFKNIKLGKNVSIKKGCRINGPLELGNETILDERVVITGPVKIGKKCHINYETWIDRYVEIKNQVGVGHRSFLVTFNHDHSDPNGRYLGRLIFKQIIIEEGAWLGCNVTILPGVEIGKGAMVGAGSVVTKNVPNNSLAVGNPAKIIKNLDD